MKNWKTIKEGQVRTYWKCPDCDDDCTVEPSWHDENGTPVCCECDIDMKYIRTEVADSSDGFEDDLAIVKVVMVETEKE